jgi:hypothetical protein
MKTPAHQQPELAEITAWAIIMNSAWRRYSLYTTRLNDVTGICQAGPEIIAPAGTATTLPVDIFLPATTTGGIRNTKLPLNPGTDYAYQPGPRRPERDDLPALAGWDCLVPGCLPWERGGVLPKLGEIHGRV